MMGRKNQIRRFLVQEGFIDVAREKEYE
jgi:hypothetical protein